MDCIGTPLGLVCMDAACSSLCKSTCSMDIAMAHQPSGGNDKGVGTAAAVVAMATPLFDIQTIFRLLFLY